LIGKKIIKFETLDSTNDYIKKHLNTLEHGTIVWALEQTKGRGRGRFGNAWTSKPGNLYLSLLLKNQEYKANIFDLHIKTSMIIIGILKEYNIKAYIKYPNDIVVKQKKISGILIETIGYKSNVNIILGIGLNVNQKEFLKLEDVATSILLEIESKLDIELIISRFIEIFNQKNDFKKMYLEYIRKSLLIGRKINYKNNIYDIKTIKRNGKILLKNDIEEFEIDFDKLPLNKMDNSL